MPENPEISLLVFASVQTLGRITIGTLITSMPKFFLLPLFEEGSGELTLALNTVGARLQTTCTQKCTFFVSTNISV